MSAIKVSELEGYRRVDAEYYQSHYLEMAQRFDKFKSLAEYKALIFHPAEVRRVYEGEGLQLVLAQNVRANRLDLSEAGFLPFEVEPEIRRNKLEPEDVVISRSGTVGEVAPYDGSPAPLYASADCLVIRCKDIPSAYLSTYFNTDIGRSLVKRGTYGAVQTHVAPDYLRTLRVPRDATTERIVEQQLKQAKERFADSERSYAQAQALLTAELGLDRLDLSEGLYSVRRASEVREAGRTDAEYFQPKYYRLLEAINNCGYKQEKLGKLIEPIRNGFDYREFSEKGTPYIRVGDIKDGRLDLDGAVKIPITRSEIRKDVSLQIGDVLFTRKGTYGNAAVVREGQEEAVISSEIMLLRLRKNFDAPMLPDYLSLFLNSDAGYKQVERHVHGVAFYSISQPDLAAVRIVILPLGVQERLAEKVQKSLAAEQEAKSLLAEAKAEVERLIEQV